MTIEIYLDTLFLVNFGMDLIILKILQKILKRKSTKVRILIASALGGIASCIIAVFHSIPITLKIFLMYIVISSLMIEITFSYKDFKSLFKATLLLYVITFFLGGILNSIYYHSNIGYYYIERMKGNLYSNQTLRYFICAGMIAFITVNVMIYSLNHSKTCVKNIYDVEIIMQGKKLFTKGFLDTGNGLIEPLTRRPVIIGEYEFLKEIIPEAIKDFIVSFYLNSKKEPYKELEDNDAIRIKYIPYHSIGKANGNLIGIIFDEVNIKIENEFNYNKKVIVAIHMDKLFMKEKYYIILHKELL